MKTLPDRKGILLEEPEYFGDRCFSEAAIHTFPELAELGEPGTHVQMSALADAARTAIVNADSGTLSRIFAFLEGILTTPKLNGEIENAVEISFLTAEDFNESLWAIDLLPANLKRHLQPN